MHGRTVRLAHLPKRRTWAALLGAVVISGLISAPAMARAAGQVDEYRPRTDKLIVVSDDAVKRKTLAGNVKVVLRDAKGRSTRADINELVAGARVLRLADPDRDKVVEKVVLRELPSGSSDCSFDTSDDGSMSWDCSLDFDGLDDDETKSCSFDGSEDSSGGANEGDRSRDFSWDCSYDQDGDEGDFSWDASYDASEGASWDGSGGDADGDTSFDASWDSSRPLETPLFKCTIVKDPLGWRCTSSALDQEFGVTLEGAPVGFEAYLDFSADHVDLDDDETSSSCSKDGPGSFSCSFDTGAEDGDCSVDVSFDSSVDADNRGGDVSGDMSYSCSYDVG
jgi:hypothetical protein